jgi:hypothetical protein
LGFDEIGFEISNVGGSAAVATTYFTDSLIDGTAVLPMHSPYAEHPGFQIEIQLAPGVIHRIIRPRLTETPVTFNQWEGIQRGEDHLWIIGWVDYEDELKTVRRTAFCRKWSVQHLRFLPTDDADYEYAD